ncbi:Uncharacterised protein [Segatella copri]|nr:Uncharacterised protein [Segatella copri]
MTSGLFSVTGFSPNLGSALMVFKSPTQAAGAIERLRKPLTTLKSAITLAQFFFRYSPISCAVSSGFFFDILRNGNTTRVRLPSKLLLVFCRATIFSGTS